MANLPSTAVIGDAELSILAESKLITAAQQRALTTATASLQAMMSAAPTMVVRHFARSDTRMLVRAASPVSEARDLLSQFNSSWAEVAKDFHVYRTKFFEAKLKRAKLTKRKKDLDGSDLTDDDRAIVEAEVMLEQASIDALESTVALGQAQLKLGVSRATAASERYTALCARSGVEQFTDEDFKREEVEYFVKSAWWHAAKVFTIHDTRDKWARPRQEARSRAEAYQMLMKAREFMDIAIDNDTLLLFQSIGVNEIMLKNELRTLLKMRETYERSAREGYLPSFAEYFDGWLMTMVEKYRGAAKGAVDANGAHLLERLGSLLDPDAKDRGDGGDVGAMRRPVMGE